MKMKKTVSILLVVFSIIFILSSQALAWSTSSEIRRLNEEAPSLDGYGKAEALVWLRDFDYKMLADGTMESTRRTVVMMGEEIPDEWKEIKIPVPDSGKLEITEAAWYNPMTGFKDSDIKIEEETLSGGAVVKIIRVPDDAVGRAVVLRVRATYPRHYGIDAVVEMAGRLPVWEQNITAELPEGKELYWSGRDIKEPLVSKNAGVQRYTWKVMNQAPWKGEGFVLYKQPLLTFSSKRGINAALADMEQLVKETPTLPMPAVAKGTAEKAGIRLMNWLAQPENHLVGYPDDWVRAAAEIPAEGPWTKWEQTLLLHKWLTKLGWDSEVLWQADEELTQRSPSSTSTWEGPVLYTSYGKPEKKYYQAGQTADYGVTSPSVAGSSLYSLKNGEYTVKRVSTGSASDHRLAFLWRLVLNEFGRAEGTLDLTVTGGWTELVSGGSVPSPEMLDNVIKRKVNFAIPGMMLKTESVTPISTGYRAKFKVSCNPGIIHAGNMLLRLPGGVPASVGEMVGKNDEYTLRYPFILDQAVRMRMPKGYRLVQVPPVKTVGEGTKTLLKETINHWPKKAELEADSTWVVKKTDVTMALASVLKEELKGLLRWPVLDLPFRK